MSSIIRRWCIVTLVHHTRARGRVRTCTGTQQRLRTKPAANDSSNFRKLLWDARLPRYSLAGNGKAARAKCAPSSMRYIAPPIRYANPCELKCNMACCSIPRVRFRDQKQRSKLIQDIFREDSLKIYQSFGTFTICIWRNVVANIARVNNGANSFL